MKTKLLVGVLALALAAASATLLFRSTEDAAPASVSTPPVQDAGGQLNLTLSGDDTIAYFTVRAAQSATFLFEYTHEDTANLDAVPFIQLRGQPEASALMLWDWDSQARAEAVLAGQGVDTASTASASGDLEPTPSIGLPPTTVTQPSEQFLIGVATSPGTDATAEIEWTGNATVEPHTSTQPPLLHGLEDLDADLAFTSQHGPTRIQNATATMPGQTPWHAAAYIVSESGPLDLCRTGQADACFHDEGERESRLLGCRAPLLAAGDALDLSLTSQYGTDLRIAAVPHLFPLEETAPAPSLDCQFE